MSGASSTQSRTESKVEPDSGPRASSLLPQETDVSHEPHYMHIATVMSAVSWLTRRILAELERLSIGGAT